ncbi:MAG: hypothetical protein ACRD4X_18635 [Candidatus Acidiferrales bacterium]
MLWPILSGNAEPSAQLFTVEGKKDRQIAEDIPETLFSFRRKSLPCTIAKNLTSSGREIRRIDLLDFFLDLAYVLEKCFNSFPSDGPGFLFNLAVKLRVVSVHDILGPKETPQEILWGPTGLSDEKDEILAELSVGLDPRPQVRNVSGGTQRCYPGIDRRPKPELL